MLVSAADDNDGDCLCIGPSCTGVSVCWGTDQAPGGGDDLCVCPALGPGDCNDSASSCTTNCSDADGDSVPDCLDLCADVDRDQFGVTQTSQVVGPGSIPVGACTTNGTTPCTFGDAACSGTDCNDAASSCTTNCGTASFGDDAVPDCLDLCNDHDGDNRGASATSLVIGGGSIPIGSCTTNGSSLCTFGDAACIGSDCNDNASSCTALCIDSDTDGVLDCLDRCIDADHDDFGVTQSIICMSTSSGGSCALGDSACSGADCLDSDLNCTTDCSDSDSDLTPDCAEPIESILDAGNDAGADASTGEAGVALDAATATVPDAAHPEESEGDPDAAAGAGAAGVAGAMGTAGSGGREDTGGVAAGGSLGKDAGTPGQGVSTADASIAGEPSSDDASCACSVPGRAPGSLPGMLLLFGLACLRARPRRHS
jgi:hypothetical protein